MVDEYLNKWFNVIENMNNDNTYKLSFGRSIIECISFDNVYGDENNKVIINFDDISKNMIKYYWNQIFFFNLKQSPYKNSSPIICQDVKKLIDKYKEITGSSFPVWYDKGLEVILEHNKEFFNKILHHVSKTLHENVCWRFQLINGENMNLYHYNKEEGSKLTFNYDDVLLLKDYGVVVSKLLNYKWAQLLEQYNYCPKIINKVNGISQAKLRRNSLTKYKDELLKQFPNGKPVDFYTGKELDMNDISIDHVIPWSYLYSDNIWNLVITSKSYNSTKSNTIPSEDVIEKLKLRNEKLKDIVDDKFKNDLEESIMNNYVDKFYYECRL